ncbi:MAG TPA: response regulator transcription factor [Dissulfurispiraceae bacterium]|nr:response regulator transcription factor [Dissulfurispiraceae bacterium]
MKRILIIDDEQDIIDLVSYNLQKEGFDVDSATDGETALAKIGTVDYDLVILDLMLPGIQGLDLCRMMRSNADNTHIPIVMLTAKGEEVDKIIGLEMGADDYVTKPFSPRELVARIKAVLRRAEQRESPPPSQTAEAGSVVKLKDIIIDRERYTVTIGERQIKLSATEFKLLLCLAERPNRIFNREHLLDAVWGNDVYVEPRTVDVHVRRLRMKIEKDPNSPVYIKTMRGIGYCIED